MWTTILERWRLFSLEQKISVGVLSICGVLAMGLSMYRLRAAIHEPFLVTKEGLVETKKRIGLTDAQKVEQQQRLDTDGDGLSDWDEANTYRTNPNLRDSCGDGLPDNVRVATGKNLNCGRPVGTGGLDTSAVQQSTSSLPLPFQLNGQTSADLAPPTIDAKGVAEQMMPRDPAFIRQMLAGSVPEDKLKQISDEDLLKLYDYATTHDADAPPAASASASSTPKTK